LNQIKNISVHQYFSKSSVTGIFLMFKFFKNNKNTTFWKIFMKNIYIFYCFKISFTKIGNKIVLESSVLAWILTRNRIRIRIDENAVYVSGSVKTIHINNPCSKYLFCLQNCLRTCRLTSKFPFGQHLLSWFPTPRFVEIVHL
jgi:hypothetical protein